MNDIRIAPVGVRDLTEITNHEIAVQNNQTIHTLTFSNGGKLQLTALGGGKVKVVVDKLDAHNNSPGTLFSTHNAT